MPSVLSDSDSGCCLLLHPPPCKAPGEELLADPGPPALATPSTAAWTRRWEPLSPPGSLTLHYGCLFSNLLSACLCSDPMGYIWRTPHGTKPVSRGPRCWDGQRWVLLAGTSVFPSAPGMCPTLSRYICFLDASLPLSTASPEGVLILSYSFLFCILVLITRNSVRKESFDFFLRRV